MTAVPSSAASKAVELLEQYAGPLTGKQAMVIGNGEMGRLGGRPAAGPGLRGDGDSAYLPPRGDRSARRLPVAAYEDRFDQMDGMDLLLSATTSPHYTVIADAVARQIHPPRWMVDLAIPRDIQPETEGIKGVRVFNVDDLEGCAPQPGGPRPKPGRSCSGGRSSFTAGSITRTVCPRWSS